jgi:excisionase family DNA binding protein
VVGVARLDDDLDLHAAAERLGVHYQTAYGWVRSGKLAARLVGGRYAVSVAEVDAFARRRTAPSRPKAPRRDRLERHAQRVHEALVSGDEATVRSLVRSLVDDGARIADVIQVVLVPSLRWIGQAWHAGELTIWVEHRASAIVERVLGEISPNPRGRRRGVAMVAALSGDRHSLPTAMAAVALREANWQVEHLGADMPADELVRFCEEHEVDLAVLTITTPEVAALASDTAARLSGAGVRVVVGGPGRTLDDLVEAANRAAGT